MPRNAEFLLHPEDELREYAFYNPEGPPRYLTALHAGANQVPAQTRGPLPGTQHPLSGFYECDWVAADPNDGQTNVTLELKTDDIPTKPEVWRNAVVLSCGAGFPAYFLPWDPRGGVIYMRLDAGGPGHFFTAALSGCSVMVDGPANDPTVYHCGVYDWKSSAYMKAPFNNPKPAEHISPQVWMDLVRHVLGHDPEVTIDKTDYVNDCQVDGKKSTVASRFIEGELQVAKGDANAKSVAWGSVCGVRDPAGDWSFYLQPNVVLNWTHYGLARAPTGCFSFFRRAPGRIKLADHRASRPIYLRRFFPTPSITHARSWHF